MIRQKGIYLNTETVSSKFPVNYVLYVMLPLTFSTKLGVIRSCTLLTCTKKGDVSLRSVKFPDEHGDSMDDASPKTWKACGSGEILVGKVDGSENFSLFGGLVVKI